MTLADAKDLAAILGTIAAILVAIVTVHKTFEELKKIANNARPITN